MWFCSSMVAESPREAGHIRTSIRTIKMAAARCHREKRKPASCLALSAEIAIGSDGGLSAGEAGVAAVEVDDRRDFAMFLCGTDQYPPRTDYCQTRDHLKPAEQEHFRVPDGCAQVLR